MTERKQRKLELNPATSTNIDRISSLPDSLLCYILSFLPTDTSVSTSILSHRWRYLWEHVQVFSFSDGSSPQRAQEGVAKCIVPFVNAALALRKFRDIQKFSLSCEITDNDVTKTWIRAAIGPHLQELHLSLNSWENDFRLPHRVFTCTALVSLALVGGIVLEELPLVHLPSLKSLEVNISRMVPIDKLFAGCPVLETLTLILCNENPHKICMPSSLKSLIFDYCSEYDIDELEIDTPSLEYLNINVMNTCLQFSVRNLDNVVEADITLFEDTYVSFVPKLLRALYKTKRLMLSESATEGLLRAPTLDFPLFSCLIHLQLGDLCFNSRFLIDLLHNCHMLQVLIISKVIDGETSEPWNQPTSVPKCVTSHLTNFEFGGYEDFADEHAFIAYILENGLVLKTMTIHTESPQKLAQKESRLELEKKKDRILRGISALPRGSNVCQLIFD